ncbi:Large2 [Phodopus roborovskii]|uniref:Large2 protein n=1 Tax=Phodopus roborovskii TaxID=109678 RepID=A0AAU9Z659_PHORO|nr:Large2 [Phodopus roborovskii]
MLPRGRSRALGAATLLLLLLLVVGFFLFGRDPEYGLPAAATFDGDLYGSRNRSASGLQPLLPPKCEVGAQGPWQLPPPGFLAPAQPSGHV